MLKKIFLLACTGFLSHGLKAQQDTTTKKTASVEDTMRIGNIIILKNGGSGSESSSSHSEWDFNGYRHHPRKPGNLATTWLVPDIGFNNFEDKTNYASSGAQAFAPGSNASWFNIRNGKSVNFNLWIFMQRLNMVKHVVNLKYGLGLEFYNFRYEQNIRFYKNPPRVLMDPSIDYSKNKLALNYITIPLMLNFNFTPHQRDYRRFGISAGISAGYLYNSRQKYISDETGKAKLKGDLGLEDFKLAYIGEAQFGPVSLYGTYATRSMFRRGLDQTPYAIGLRLSHW